MPGGLGTLRGPSPFPTSPFPWGSALQSVALSWRMGADWLLPKPISERSSPSCLRRGGAWGWRVWDRGALGPRPGSCCGCGLGAPGRHLPRLSIHPSPLEPSELSQTRAPPIPSQRMFCTLPYSCIQTRILRMRKSDQPTDRGRKHTLPLIFN